MRKYLLLPLLVLGCLIMLSSLAYANLQATFDTGAEGWTGFDPTGDWTAAWQSSGGNPGGFMLGTENTALGETGYFVAPSPWTGNLSSYIGGNLKYDEKIILGTAYFSDNDVKIYSGSSYLAANLATGYWSGWKTFSVDLDPANFTVVGSGDFASIMADVTALWIRGEYINGAPEQEGLDNVFLTSTVPIPPTVWLFGFGLSGLIGARRFKRS